MNFEFDAGSARPVDAAGGDGFDPSTATPLEEAGIGRKAADLGLSVAKGIVGVPQAAVGVADILTGGKAGKALENAGVRFNEAQDILSGWQSQDLKAKQQEFANADGVLPKLGVALRNPSLIANAAAESLPSMGESGVVARGALPLVARLGAYAPTAAGAIGEGVVGAGQAAEQYRQETPNGELTPKQAGLAAASGLADTVLAGAGGAAARRLGIGDVDTMIAQGTRQVAGKPQSMLRRAGEGFLSEGLLEEAPQSAAEQVLQNVALDKPLGQDVAGQVVMGGLTGGLMGAGAGAVSQPHAAPAPAPGPLQRAAALVATTSPGASPGPSNTPQAVPPEAPDLTTAPGATPAYDKIDFRREVDTGNLGLVDPQEEARARAARVDFQPTDTTPNWDTAAGAAPAREGLEMPGRVIDTSGLEIQREGGPLATLPGGAPAPRGNTGPLAAAAGLAEVAPPPALPGPKAIPSAPMEQDIVAEDGQPFRNGIAAALAAKAAGPGFRAVRINDRQFVVRRAPSDVIDVQAKEAPAAPARVAALPAPTVDAGAHQAAASPRNSLPAPTKGQILAGNAKLGHARIGGLGLSIENPAGSVREDKQNTPPKWRTPMTNGYHYGYFKRTEAADSTDAKRQGIDAFVKEGLPENYNGPVFVVDQVDPNTGRFDEHKVLVGPRNEREAMMVYRKHYQRGWKGGAAVTRMEWPQFKEWVRSGKKELPAAIDPNAPGPAAAAPVPESGPGQRPDAAAAGAGGPARAAPAAAVAETKPAQPETTPPKAETKGLRLGTTPGDAEPVTVRDGVVHIGKYPAVNFDSGEPVTVNAGASDEQVRQALKNAGALSSRQRFFGGEKAAAQAPAAAQKAASAPAASSIPRQPGPGGTLQFEPITGGDARDGTYTVAPARYAKGKVGVQVPSSDGFKTRAGRLADSIAKGSYSNRESAYIMSPMQAERFMKLHAEGWDVNAVSGNFRAPEKVASSPRAAADSSQTSRAPSEALPAGRGESRGEAPKAPQASAPSPAPAPVAADKIEDFGEKITGARKDYAALLKDAMDVDVAAAPLSKSWPEPDYGKLLQAGTDPWTVAFVHAARDSVPTKPQKSWKLKPWAEQVKTLRNFADQLLSGRWKRDAVDPFITRGTLRDLGNTVELYERLGHDISLKGVTVSSGSYSVYRGENFSPAKTIWTVEQKAKATAFSNMPRELASGDTREAAINAFVAKMKAQPEAADKAKKTATFDLWRQNGKVHVGKKIGRQYVSLKVFDGTYAEALKAAREYRDAHLQELTQALERYRSTPMERAAENAPRVGDDHRTGARVTPEIFHETFGFRGVQFGNYVENDRRQQDLNDAYDGLMDMAAVLGVPPRALSLNGQLGLAFGARGKGGKGAPSAHYESGQVVINLTKGGGAGALGHEWFHALDNYFGKTEGGHGYMTAGAANAKVRAEMRQAFEGITAAIRKTGMAIRSRRLDERKSKPYWSTPIEMAARAYESYLVAKLQDQNARNDYLANIVGEDFWNAQDALLGHENEQTYPYPTEKEMGPIREAFDHFFSTVQTREEGGNVAMFSRASEQSAATMDPGAVQDAVARLTGDWLRRPDVHVLDSMDDAPPRVREIWQRQNSQGGTGAIEGFHYKGGVYLVADALESEADVRRVLFHEALGHWGLRGVFGERLKPILQQLATLRPQLIERKARQYGLDLNNPAERLMAAEEVLAELAQTRPQIGFVQRAIAAIRQWLRGHGVRLAMTDTEVIASYILPARGWVERGRAEAPSSVLAPAAFSREDTAFSRAEVVGATRTYTPEQERAMRNVGFEVETPSLKERAQALWKDAGKKLAQGIVDQFAPVKDLDREAYSLLRLSKGASGAFETLLNGGMLKLTGGVYDFDEANKGGVVDKLLVPLQGEHHDFFRWIAANRAERLAGEGKENLFTPEDIAALKTLADGELKFDYTIQNGPRAGQTTRSRAEAYADSLKTFNAFNRNVLDLAEQSGLIDGESRQVWEHEFYVPFYRVSDDFEGGFRGANVKSGVVRQRAFEQLKGGREKLNADLLDNTLLNWAHLIDAAAKNRAAKATLEAAERLGVAISAPESTARQIGKATGNRNGVVWFMDGGMQRHFVVEDPYLLTALTSLEYAGMRNPVMDAMGTFKHALTVGVTASPFFKIRNLIRDSVQAIASGPLSFNPAKNIAEGWKATSPKSDAYFRLMASGGTIHFGTMLEGSEAKRVDALVKSGVSQATILDSQEKVQAFFHKFIEPAITAYNELGNRGEAINRAALYNQLVAQGVSHAEAALQARDLMDFSMQGSFTSIRFLTQVVPFFNARIQGLYKLGRAAKEDPARLSAVLGATALVSIGLMAGYAGDDDWKKREDWDRNNFWWFKFGGTAFRIPKPFEIGAIATVAERGLEAMFDSEMTGERFRKNVLQLLGDNLSMNPIPQLVKPIIDVYANKDSFTGRPIETMGMERLRPEYRFTNRTSMAARGASTVLNAAAGAVGAQAPSPVQIDHLLRGYFSWLGSFVVGAGDTIARPLTEQPKQAAPDYWKVLTGSMVSELEGAPSRYVSQMYDQAREIEQAYGTWKMLVKEGKVQEAEQFRAEHQEQLAKYHTLERAKRGQSFLNQRIRAIERSDMEPQEKKLRIQQVREQQDRLARGALPGAAR